MTDFESNYCFKVIPIISFIHLNSKIHTLKKSVLQEEANNDYRDAGAFITSNNAYKYVTAENKVIWMKAFIIITIYT